MTDDSALFTSALSRRGLLAGVAGTAAAVGLPVGSAAAAPAGSQSWERRGDPVVTPPVSGLHLQFGRDAASEVVVTWHTLQPVSGARVLLGTSAGYQRSAGARTESYTDAKTGQTVYVHHASLRGLRPDREYLYLAVHEGAEPEFGSFRTAPRGRGRFTFTSFGDQGTPTVARSYQPPTGFPLQVNDNLGSAAAGDTVAGVERVRPLFHLFNGDLAYAALSVDRVRSWWDFFTNNSRSARHRPWMPCAGNHENERGNGAFGFRAYQTFFGLPEEPGQTEDTRRLWYSFTVGSVRVISLQNDDIAYQDSGDTYVRGYSKGEQKRWLESELARARRDEDVDWVVVCMHEVAISTADKFNGADLGVRQEWLPLFDRYGVDLVVCGHEHHYERSHPIRGQQQNQTLTPIPRSTQTSVVDTTAGTVHMIIGGGGTSAPSNALFFDPPACRVIVAVGPPDPATGKRPPVYVREDAPWSAVRDRTHSYGFAAFDVDPGTRAGGVTRMTVTYYDVLGPDGALAPFETFTLQRPRSDARR